MTSDQKFIDVAKSHLENPTPGINVDGIDIQILKSDISEFNRKRASMIEEEQAQKAASIKTRLVDLGQQVIKARCQLIDELKLDDMQEKKPSKKVPIITLFVIVVLFVLFVLAIKLIPDTKNKTPSISER